MISNAAAYYLWPTVWVSGRPKTSGVDIDVRTLGEEVYRTSLSVGITTKVLREGMFIFDFSGWAPGRALSNRNETDFDATAAVILRRVTVLNAHLACLYTTLSDRQHEAIDKMVVSPSDVIALKSLDDSGMGFGDMRVGALALARYPSTYAQGVRQMFDWRVSMRTVVIEIDTVAESFQLLDTVLRHPAPHALTVTDLYVRSCKAYEDHNYSLCLVTAWAITEKLLQELWDRYLKANRERTIDGVKVTFINRHRREKLTDSRDFRASVISEILSLTNSLPFSLYENLSRVRQARNDWLHGLKPLSRETAVLSVSVAEQMLNLVDGLNLRVPLISRVHE